MIKAELQHDVNEKVTNMMSKLSYTGACKRKEHLFGQISCIPKLNGLKANDDWGCVNFCSEEVPGHWKLC